MAVAKKAAAAAAKSESAEPEICLECFPGGWGPPLDADAYAAGCSHGQYTHPGRKPSDDGGSVVLDVDDAGEVEGDEVEQEPVQF